MATESPVPIGVEGKTVTTLMRRASATLPLWGSLLAAVLIVSRRPDAITHAQFWAEDGKQFYADVYNHGMLATLAVPQGGYFLELPTIAATLAQLVPLVHAPLVMNSIGIVVRVLPVGLLLSRRADTISPDLRVRVLLAALFIALPGSDETDANAVNASWYLAIAAVIVLISRPPEGAAARVLDLVILVLCSVTGVFVIVLAPLAFVYRRWAAQSAISRAKLAILAVGAGIQLLALLVLQYHLPSGFGATSRPSLPLQWSIQGFFEILGVRVFAEPIMGNAAAPSSTTAVLVGVLGFTGMLVVFQRGGAVLRMTVAFGAAVFVMSLARPLGTNWPGLISASSDSRYFVIPQFVFVAILVWACGYFRSSRWIIPLVAITLCMCAMSIPKEWRYPALREIGFEQRASQFEHARSGTMAVLPIQPGGWRMILLKH